MQPVFICTFGLLFSHIPFNFLHKYIKSTYVQLINSYKSDGLKNNINSVKHSYVKKLIIYKRFIGYNTFDCSIYISIYNRAYGTYKKRFTSNFNRLPTFYAFNTIKLQINHEHLTIKCQRLFVRVMDELLSKFALNLYLALKLLTLLEVVIISKLNTRVLIVFVNRQQSVV